MLRATSHAQPCLDALPDPHHRVAPADRSCVGRWLWTGRPLRPCRVLYVGINGMARLDEVVLESAAETTIGLVYKLVLSAHAGSQCARRLIWWSIAGERRHLYTITHALERRRGAGPGCELHTLLVSRAVRAVSALADRCPERPRARRVSGGV